MTRRPWNFEVAKLTRFSNYIGANVDAIVHVVEQHPDDLAPEVRERFARILQLHASKLMEIAQKLVPNSDGA